MDTNELLRRLRAMRDDHNAIITRVESARARIVSVEALYDQLADVSTESQELLRIAMGCAEHVYYRPAIIMAWAAVIDRVVEVLSLDNFGRLRSARPKWDVTSRDGLLERYPEFQIIDALRDAGLAGKTLQKTLHGQLHDRNRAAHASHYRPTFNMALGYIESALSSLRDLGRTIESYGHPA